MTLAITAERSDHELCKIEKRRRDTEPYALNQRDMKEKCNVRGDDIIGGTNKTKTMHKLVV